MLNFEKIGKRNLCLIGLMGSGKSVIGKELGKFYKIKHFDSDSEIEKVERKKINVIFKTLGENYFRKVEEEICIGLLEKHNCIISLGGGSVINKKIRDHIEKYSYSIYVKVNIEILANRLKNSIKRPLLNVHNKEEKLRELYNKRKKFYNNANLIIENNFDKSDIVSKIKTKI